MELVNRTALPAACGVGDGWDDDHQAGVVTAKATFTYEPGEGLALDTQSPLPLFDDDEPTRWGVIPRDDLPREGDDFEVIFLGCAHAPRGAAVEAMDQQHRKLHPAIGAGDGLHHRSHRRTAHLGDDAVELHIGEHAGVIALVDVADRAAPALGQ